MTMTGTANDTAYSTYRRAFLMPSRYCIQYYTKCTRPPFYTLLPDLHMKYCTHGGGYMTLWTQSQIQG